MKNENDSSLVERRVLGLTAASGVGASVLTLPFASVGTALGVLLGAAVALANFWLLARIVRASLTSGSLAGWGIAALLKLSVVFVVMYWLFTSGRIAVLPFVFGLGTLPIAIVLSQLWASRPVVGPHMGEQPHVGEKS